MVFFVPPRASQLQELVRSGHYPAPAGCETHVEELDFQSVPENVAEFGQDDRHFRHGSPRGRARVAERVRSCGAGMVARSAGPPGLKFEKSCTFDGAG